MTAELIHDHPRWTGETAQPPSGPAGLEPRRRAYPIRAEGHIPERARALVLKLCGGDLGRLVREVDGSVTVYNSPQHRELMRQVRRAAQNRQAQAAYAKRKAARQRAAEEAAESVRRSLEAYRAEASSAPARPQARKARRSAAGTSPRRRHLQVAPEAPTAPLAPAVDVVATTSVYLPPIDPDDDWWDPSTGTLVVPVSEAVQARQDLLAKRETAHAEALVEHERRRVAELERRARQAPSVKRKAERKAVRKAASDAKLIRSTNRDHARFGVPMNQVDQRHQVVLERAALAALGKLRKSGDTGRLHKVVGALDVLRTEGPDYPSLRTKRLGGTVGTGEDGQPVYQSNAENGTASAWRVWWSWGEADDQGRARIRVLDLRPHSSGAWAGGGAG